MTDVGDVRWAYIFSTKAHVVDVEGDDGHGGGKRHEADGDAVVESWKSQSEIWDIDDLFDSYTDHNFV